MIFMLAFTLNVALSATSRGEAGRALPERGAPLVIKKVFTSPAGEVQFVAGGDREAIFLRTSEGAICEIGNIDGEEDCRRFADLDEQDLPSVRCMFSFEAGGSACRHRIFSFELQESDLFRVVKAATRARAVEATRAH